MHRRHTTHRHGVFWLVVALSTGSWGCSGAATNEAPSTPEASGTTETPANAEMIERAMSAAPRFVSERATIYESLGNRTVLREGTNGFFCFPEFGPPKRPFCMEQEGLDLLEALMAKKSPPPRSKVSVLYALQGLYPGTNEDPLAPPEEQAKHVQTDGGPHIALLVPDAKVFEGITTNPQEGRPWVMYKGTPYEHLMVPTPEL
jgi:hypothetical protein